jgi:hypothetical protein
MITIEERTYPDTPGVEIGKCFKKLNMFMQQRENDVLLVNTDMCIVVHPVGFLYDYDETMKNTLNYDGELLKECTLEEFSEALNETIFNMSILNGKYKDGKTD